MTRINVYLNKSPIQDRFIPGDRFIIPLIRRLLRGKRIGGIEKVFINLCKGFDELKIDYIKNTPFKDIKPNEAVIVLGIGHYALDGYEQPNHIIAGIGLMTHPATWPNLLEEFPVAKYLQHSTWTRDIYLPYFGKNVCEIWPSGIETDKWMPKKTVSKKYDVLIYDKIMWCTETPAIDLKLQILEKINNLGLSYLEIKYGSYKESDYLTALQQSRSMIFLCEHESQGFACCEALSMDVPVLAWDQGLWLDPWRFEWNDPVVPATSIPFFDDRCGMAFKDYPAFNQLIGQFWAGVLNNSFHPRNYILENLTLKKSAEKMLAIVTEVYG